MPTYDPFTPDDESWPVVPGDDNWGRKLNQKLNQFFDSMIGTIWMSASDVVPDGYFPCLGQSLVRATYPKLFAKIGTRYGSVDSTHFSLPDWGSKFPIGSTAAGASVVTGGSASVSIAHTHDMSHVHTLPSHTHPIQLAAFNDINVADAGISAGGDPSESNYAWRITRVGQQQLSGEAPAFTGTSDSWGGGDGNSGGSSSANTGGSSVSTVNVMNPYQSVNYFIFYDWMI